MSNLMRIKSKAHSLVNYAFYGVFFVSGFILGKIHTTNHIADIFNNFIRK